jgi:putative glutamine amidotransferase
MSIPRDTTPHATPRRSTWTRIETTLRASSCARRWTATCQQLAICRGLQLLNAVLGGTLAQHIERHHDAGQQEVHKITIESHSKLRSILEVDQLVVNSRHHQCVDRLARGLAVVASPPDNVVEAMELPGKRFVLKVQWHPEDRTDGPDGKLFESFRDAMRLSS